MSDDLRQTYGSTGQFSGSNISGPATSDNTAENCGCFQPGPETIEVEQVLGAEMTQTVVEFDMLVPDPKPDIEQVIDVYVKDVEINSVDVIAGSVIVRGDLEVKVMYVADLPNEPVHAYERKHVRFTTDIPVDGAQNGMDAEADVTVEYVNYDFHRHHNRRKVHVAIVVKCWTRVVTTTEMDVYALGPVTGVGPEQYNSTSTPENVVYSSGVLGGDSASASASASQAGGGDIAGYGEQNTPVTGPGNMPATGPGYMSVAGPGITPTAGTAMGPSGTATITGTSVNIRTGPGTNFPIVTKVTQGSTVTISEQAFGWYKVVLPDGATTGWVASWLVDTGSGVPTAPKG
jgi:hypothetical protein